MPKWTSVSLHAARRAGQCQVGRPRRNEINVSFRWLACRLTCRLPLLLLTQPFGYQSLHFSCPFTRALFQIFFLHDNTRTWAEKRAALSQLFLKKLYIHVHNIECSVRLPCFNGLSLPFDQLTWTVFHCSQCKESVSQTTCIKEVFPGPTRPGKEKEYESKAFAFCMYIYLLCHMEQARPSGT